MSIGLFYNHYIENITWNSLSLVQTNFAKVSHVHSKSVVECTKFTKVHVVDRYMNLAHSAPLLECMRDTFSQNLSVPIFMNSRVSKHLMACYATLKR